MEGARAVSRTATNSCLFASCPYDARAQAAEGFSWNSALAPACPTTKDGDLAMTTKDPRQYSLDLLERLIEVQSKQTRLAIQQAKVAQEQTELALELCREQPVERIGPQPAGPASGLALVKKAG